MLGLEAGIQLFRWFRQRTSRCGASLTSWKTLWELAQTIRL